MPTRYCARCGRPLFEDVYCDWDGKDVTCEPSCEQLTEDIARVRRVILGEDDPTRERNGRAAAS